MELAEFNFTPFGLTGGKITLFSSGDRQTVRALSGIVYISRANPEVSLIHNSLKKPALNRINRTVTSGYIATTTPSTT